MLPFGRKPHQNDAGTSPDDNESARNGRHMAPVPGTPATPDKTEVFESRIGVIGPADADEDAEAREAYESLMRHRKVRRRKKRIKVGVILGVVAIIAVTIAQVIQGGAQSEGPAISTAFVTRGEFSDSVSASGSIKPVSSTVVTPEVDGIIQDVRVAEGSAVDRGDRLFSVKNDELDKAVRKAAQQVKTAKNEVGKAQAALETARRGAAAVTEGGQRGDASSVEMAKTDLESAKISLEEARSAYDDAVAQADKRTVTAPCDGTIIVMNAVNGASVGSPGGAGAGSGSSAGAGSAGALMTIADLSRMKVTVQINEVDVSRIAVGQRARVTFSALRQLVCECLHPRRALLTYRRRHLIAPPRRRCSLARRIREDVHPCKAHLTHEIQPHRKILLRLTRESHNDIRRDCNARHRRTHLLQEMSKRRRIIVTVHRAQHVIAPRLQRQMQMCGKARLRPHQLEEIRRQLHRLQ